MTPSRGADYFERLYQADADPWRFLTSDYEREKYRTTIGVLGGRRYRRGLEIGCSIGVLTQQLAAHCDALLALDVAQTALAAAQARCRALAHVTFENRMVPASWPVGQTFDLIVISEVLYFLSREDVAATARLACDGLAAGGRIVLVNYTGAIEEPCGGDEAAEIFMAAANPMLREMGLTRPEYRVDVLRWR